LPATSYIVTAQVALLAASLAYLRPSKPTVLASQATAEREVIGGDALTGRLARVGLADPDQKEEGRRFPLAESQDLEPIAIAERAMGTTPAATLRNQGDGSGLPRATAVSPQASQPKLSGVGPTEGPSFEPVPDGAGYSITADAATNFDLKTKTVVFAGHVSLHCEDFTLASDRLVVHMESESGQLSRLVANGNVEVHLTKGPATEQYHGAGEEAVYEPAKQTLLLLGWPRIRGQGREHRAASAGTRMTLHLNPARLFTEGRAQTRILPGEGGSFSGLGGQAAVQ
jgi:lipopolysaccharide transport protein LptA